MTCRSTSAMLVCEQCSLHQWRTQVVPGHGDPNADIAFVAEAPGGEEDRVGEPLVGPAGQRFDRQLAAAGLPRDQIFVSEMCTASHRDAFCSYRRDGVQAGRMAAAIRKLELRSENFEGQF